MTDTAPNNPYMYSTLSGTPTVQLIDSVDYPHTGLIKSLSQGIRGNYAVKTATDFNITMADGGSYTTIAVTAGKVYRDGKLHTVDALSALTMNTAYNPGTGVADLTPIPAGDIYLILVAKDNGGSNDTMVIRGANNLGHNKVPQLVEGDVPIALIKVVAGSADDAADTTNRMIQYFTTAKTENSVSVGYNASGYTETLAIESSSGDTNIIASVADTDINFKGTDGGSVITALQLDMALAGKATFNGAIASGAITSTGVITGTGFTIGSAAILEAELEILDGATLSTADLNIIDGISDSGSLTAAELLYVDGVTSAIQTQLLPQPLPLIMERFGLKTIMNYISKMDKEGRQQIQLLKEVVSKLFGFLPLLCILILLMVVQH